MCARAPAVSHAWIPGSVAPPALNGVARPVQMHPYGAPAPPLPVATGIGLAGGGGDPGGDLNSPPPPASGSAVPEILIPILYLKATETAPAYHPAAAQRSLHINRDIVIHLK